MASILPLGKTQFIDQNGLPLVGGQVFYYAPGTTNPQATYQDSAETIPNPNPVLLDSRGQATIWGSGTYRQVVQDVNGVTIWDQVVSEPTAAINSAIAAISANLAAPNGSSLVGFQQQGTAPVPRTVQAKAAETLSLADFWTSGDATTALTNALNEWKTTGNTLVIGPGNYTISKPITIDFQGYPAGNIVMLGSINPTPGIGRAILIKNAAGGSFNMQVSGGGQTANYTQSDPSGADEAFTFLNCLLTTIEVTGQNYQGRVLRITSDGTNPSGFQSQWMDIRSVTVSSSAPISSSASARLAQGVGQAFYIDTFATAFGHIRHTVMEWELYGSVIESTTDIVYDHAETLYMGNSGMRLSGVISFWGGKLNLGSGLTGTTFDLLTINDYGANHCQQMYIESVFLNFGFNGINASNVGLTPLPGLSIGNVFTRGNSNRGMLFNNCPKLFIGNAQCYADNVCLELAGAMNMVEINLNTNASVNQAIIVDAAVTGNVVFRGSASNGNTSNSANTPLIQVLTVASVIFDNFIASSGSVNYLYSVPSGGNVVEVIGGRVVLGSGAALYDNEPHLVTNVIGWLTGNMGTATIANGTNSAVVTHGLVKAPDRILITPRDPGAVGAYAPTANRNSTQFTVLVAANVTANSQFDWIAKTDNAGV